MVLGHVSAHLNFCPFDHFSYLYPVDTSEGRTLHNIGAPHFLQAMLVVRALVCSENQQTRESAEDDLRFVRQRRYRSGIRDLLGFSVWDMAADAFDRNSITDQGYLKHTEF